MAPDQKQFLFLMFVDIPSALVVSEAEGAVAGREFLEECMALIAAVREEHGGTLIRTVGNSLLATFELGDGALAAACEMQEAVADAPRTTQTPPSLRIGIQVGEVVLRQGRCVGEAVTTTARMVSLAKPNQILVTEEVGERISDDTLRAKLSTFEGQAALEKRLHVTLREAVWRAGVSATAADDAGTGLELVQDDLESGTQDMIETIPIPLAALGASSAVRQTDSSQSSAELELDETPLELDLSQTAQELNVTPQKRGGKGAQAGSAPSSAAAARKLGSPKRKKADAAGGEKIVLEEATDEDEFSAASAAGNVRLCLICGGNVITVDKDRRIVSLGRDEKSDIVVTVDTASRSHADVELRDGDFYLVDHSGNGTFAYDEKGAETFVCKGEVKLAPSGAICPGCTADDPACEALLYWTATS